MLIDWSLETVDGRETVLQLVSTILSISACNGQYPTQETISEMPFGFWYIFQASEVLFKDFRKVKIYVSKT